MVTGRGMLSGHETLLERLDRLESELGEVRRRLASLEERGESASPVPSTATTATITPSAADGRPSTPAAVGFGWSTGSVAVIGRTFLVLAGAFLLRALTDGGFLPGAYGVVAGLGYAAIWLLAGEQAARHGQRLSADLHGLAAGAISCALIWETTTRMGQLSTEASAVALVAYFATGLALAWRSDSPALAWITTLFALATAGALLFATKALAVYGLVLVLLAAWTEVMAVFDRWPGLRALPTLGASAAVLLLADTLAGPRGLPPGYPAVSIPLAISIALLLPAIYVASLIARTVWRETRVPPFEIVLLLVAVASGLGGGAWMLAAQRTAPLIVGGLSMLLSAGCYAAAWKVTRDRTGSPQNHVVLASFGLLLALAGTAMLLSGSALALFWSALAIALGTLGWRYRAVVLSLHGSAFLLGAAVASGLVFSVWDAIAAAAANSWRSLAPAGYVAAVAAAFGYTVLLAARSRTGGRRTELLASLLTAAILSWSLAGLILWGLASFAAAPGPRADAAVLATIRTAVLAGMTVGLSWIGRRWARDELIWLAYSLLALGGAKLLFEDFLVGRPVTLFASLACYGGALILTSRLIRRAMRQMEGAGG